MSHAYAKLPLTLRLAARELRGGLRGFRVFLACLFLGVAAIAGVGSLANAILLGLEQEGQTLLAGDVEVRLFQREASGEELEYLASTGTVSRNTRLRAMARATGSGERTLTEIKAADDLYPLYGGFRTDPPLDRETLVDKRGGHWGIAIPPELADRLRVDIGDEVRIGDALFEVRALIDNEPDRTNEGIQWGPTVFMHWDALAETNTVQIGSLIHYHYRLQLPPEADIEVWTEALGEKFPEANWRVRDRTGSAPGVRRFVERMGMFLTLVGLTALMVGGVGVGNAVRAYLDGKTETIATLKTLGARGDMIFRVYLTQILMIGLVGIALGLVVGGVVPFMLSEALSERIPVPPAFGFYPGPLVTAGVYGVLITVAFAVWPLAKARDIPAARLFRQVVSPDNTRPRWRYLAVIAAAIGVTLAIAILLSELKMLAAGFALGTALVLGFLKLTGYLVQKGAAKLPRPKRPGLRLALANLHRPGAATGAVVLSLGLGLTLLSAIALIEQNLSARVQGQIPEQAPAFFMIDIQKDQAEAFRTAAEAIEGISEVRIVPALRGRIIRINGIATEDAVIAPEQRWVVSGDRSLTYANDVPEGNVLVAGEWWDADYAGPPLVSFSAEEAAGLGVTVGSTITLNILGREFTATIANLRQLDWGTMGFNFVVVFAPGTLETAPHTHMATLMAEGDAERTAHRLLTDAFPNITAIRMKEVLETINGVLSEIGVAVRATALVTILAGILVLAGAMAAGQRARVYDAVIMKVLGAVRRDVLKAYVLEYVALGLITGVVALALGTAAGYVVVVYVMDLDFGLYPGAMLLTIVASIGATLFFGLIGTWAALGAKPMAVLREQ